MGKVNYSAFASSFSSVDETFFNIPENQSVYLDVDDLTSFKNHPYRVLDDDAMDALIESVQSRGVLSPILVRPIYYKDSDKQKGYEIISGHRRVHAAGRLKMAKIPAIVMELDDDAAAIAMVESNFQRENILPSEKAWAYRMRYDAMKRTAGRPAKNSCQLGTNFPTGESERQENNSCQLGTNFQSGVTVRHQKNSCQLGTNLRTDEKVAEGTEDSARTVQRYIRLTYLIKPLLDNVDDGKLAMNAGVALSYLSVEQQEYLHSLIECDEVFPNLKQAEQMKAYATQNSLTEDLILSVLTDQSGKTKTSNKIEFKRKELASYFPPGTTAMQMQEQIVRLLAAWRAKGLLDHDAPCRTDGKGLAGNVGRVL